MLAMALRHATILKAIIIAEAGILLTETALVCKYSRDEKKLVAEVEKVIGKKVEDLIKEAKQKKTES